jgi:hypothetical protein
MPHEDGSLTPAERLASIEKKQDEMRAILDELRALIASLPLRVRALEVVVYGGCGLCLTALLVAVIALVVK